MLLAAPVLMALLAQPGAGPDTLVRRLGSDDFATRETAEAELSRMGLPALAAIEAGLGDPDPEVRRRCLVLSASLRKQGQVERLTRFVGGSDDLPGWKRFRALLGQRPETRKVYAEIYGSDPGFIDDVEARPAQAAVIIAAKVQTLQLSQAKPINIPARAAVTTNDAALVLFAAQHPDARIPSDKLHLMTSLLYAQNIQGALSGKNGAVVNEELRAIVLGWMRAQTDIQAQMQSLYLCQNLDLKDGVLLAGDLLRGKKLPPHGRGVAITLIGRLGGKANIPDLVPLLSDPTHMNNFQVRPKMTGTVQVRDVALAVLVHLTGQSHKVYGFGFAQVDQVFQMGSTYNLGFLDTGTRDSAIVRWDEYAKANGIKARP